MVILGTAIVYYGKAYSFGNNHGLRAFGIFIMAIGWIAAILMAKLQNYIYLLPMVAQFFKRGRLKLDEREQALRGKVFEQSYILVSFIAIAALCYTAFIAPSVHISAEWVERPFFWIFLNLIILFGLMSSLLAALQTKNQA